VFKNLISDRASTFLGVVMTSFLELFGITKISTTSYSPRSNLKVERLQKTLIDVSQGHVRGRKAVGNSVDLRSNGSEISPHRWDQVVGF